MGFVLTGSRALLWLLIATAAMFKCIDAVIDLRAGLTPSEAREKFMELV